MEDSEFEGTELLEKLASIGKVDAFFQAVDLDDFALAKALLKRAGIDAATIRMVLKKMLEGDHSDSVDP